MRSDLFSGCQDTPYKPASLSTRLLGWLKSRFQDIMVTADVLHDAQWTAPWDDSQSSRRHGRGLTDLG